MPAYYNEIDPDNVEGLRELIDGGHIAPGDIDGRDIREVRRGDLRGYSQCHFFAGIGGWSIALRLAGWPDDGPIWTGSCPCQPFSEAGNGLGFADPRDLFPTWFDLGRQCRPATVLGEQVASAAGVFWADRAASCFEAENYAFGSPILPAAGVRCPMRRDRFYFVAHAVCPDTGRRIAPRWRSPLPAAVERAWSVAGWNGGQSCYGRLADGLPGHLAKKIAGGFGNAIVPELAAQFIAAALE